MKKVVNEEIKTISNSCKPLASSKLENELSNLLHLYNNKLKFVEEIPLLIEGQIVKCLVYEKPNLEDDKTREKFYEMIRKVNWYINEFDLNLDDIRIFVTKKDIFVKVTPKKTGNVSKKYSDYLEDINLKMMRVMSVVYSNLDCVKLLDEKELSKLFYKEFFKRMYVLNRNMGSFQKHGQIPYMKSGNLEISTGANLVYRAGRDIMYSVFRLYNLVEYNLENEQDLQKIEYIKEVVLKSIDSLEQTVNTFLTEFKKELILDGMILTSSK